MTGTDLSGSANAGTNAVSTPASDSVFNGPNNDVAPGTGGGSAAATAGPGVVAAINTVNVASGNQIRLLAGGLCFPLISQLPSLDAVPDGRNLWASDDFSRTRG
jgi:hypothetical protein